MAERELRAELLNTLLTTPHRNLAALHPVHESMIDQDPLFYVHLAAWYADQGTVRDHKEMFVSMLSLSEFEGHRDVGLALLRRLPPYEVARVVDFIKGREVVSERLKGRPRRGRKQEVEIVRERVGLFRNVPRSMKTEITHYLREREASEKGFDRVAMSGLVAAEANRFHRKQDALYFKAVSTLLSGDAAALVEAYPYDLSVTDDDQPFFYHFFRWGHWQEVKERLGQSWILYAGWGYLLGLLALVVLIPTAGLLILVPLTVPALRRQIAHRPGAVLGYFGAIGLGFMLIEIALIQKALLVMNAPTSAFAVVVVAVLLGAGAGSLWSGRTNTGRVPTWAAPLLIGVLALAAPGLIDLLAARPAAHGMQVAALLLLLCALAFPMGTLLPRGIARIRGRGSGAVAWAWGVNGFCSVLGALAAPLMAIEIGFMGVMGVAVGMYLLAALLFGKL